ncbi:MAG: hypothetical protein JNG84_06860 [Archangium sp.]|nr:hypothetical protein [Archangium sp.]
MKRALPLLFAACAQVEPSVVPGTTVPGTAWTAKGEVALRCDPGDADVLLDGVARGRCDEVGRLDVKPGPHRLEVKKHGFQSWVRLFDADRTRMVLKVALAAEGERSP